MNKIILSDLYIGNFPVTQEFGARPTYYGQFGLKGHEGQDIGMDNGKLLICPFDEAIVVRVVRSLAGPYGKHTVLWDSKQLAAVWYCHCQEIVREVGEVVYKHNLVALSNNTGNSTGPHLHWSVCRTDANGVRTNQDNGYIGMLDSRNNVDWRIENPSKPTEGDQSMGEISPAHQECLNQHGPLVDKAVKLETKLEEVKAAALVAQEDFNRAKVAFGIELDKVKELYDQDHKIVAMVADKLDSTQNYKEISAVIEKLKNIENDLRMFKEFSIKDKLKWQGKEIKLNGQIELLEGRIKILSADIAQNLEKADIRDLLKLQRKLLVAILNKLRDIVKIH